MTHYWQAMAWWQWAVAVLGALELVGQIGEWADDYLRRSES